MDLDFSVSLPEFEMDAAQNEGIAVIGMALQIGSATSEEEFWQKLCCGEDMIGEFPEERKKEIAPFRERMYGKDAAFVQRAYLPQISGFDAEYFHLTPPEAQMMDPAQRLFLESAFSCLQNAGYEEAIRGSRTGVYVGHSNSDVRYEQLIDMGMGDTSYAAGVKISGNVESMIAARVSYLLNLQGPAMLINTACSSSLSALHLACDALRSGQIDAALVGAVKLYLVPAPAGEATGGIQIASSSGRTKTFDAQADGTGGGEGVITFLLKPLSMALADGDHIRAVIRGSCLNQDGASMGITAPNPEAQARLLRECWRECGIEPTDLSYIEAHGTGTKLGDPIELEALTKAFADSTKRRQFCAIGSVKSNVGHLDCAAGLAGLAKTVLMLENGMIPPTIHFQVPNTQIDFINSPVYVCDKAESWAPPQGRICGVSSFGISGTNAHVVLEQAPLREMTKSGQGQSILLISGQNEACLLENWRRLREYASKHAPDMYELCYSAATGRSHRAWRVALVLDSVEQFVAIEPKLEASDRVFFGNAKPAAVQPLPMGASLRELARDYVSGAQYAWDRLWPDAHRLPLPPYCFSHRSYWVEHHAIEMPTQRFAPCIDEHIELSDGSSLFRCRLSTARFWELREHTMEGTHILPGTVYIEMLLEAGRQLLGSFRLQDVVFLASYACQMDEVAELQITARPDEEKYRVSIRSKKQGESDWESHAEGVLVPQAYEKPERISIDEFLRQAGQAQTVETQNNGPIKIGARWLSLDRLWKTDETMTAHFCLQEQYRSSLQDYEAYPSLLDGAVNAANVLNPSIFCLPFSYKRVEFYRPLPPAFYSHATAYAENRLQQKLFTYDVMLYTEQGDVIAKVEGYTLKKVELLCDVLKEKRYHRLQWIEKRPAQTQEQAHPLVIVCTPEQVESPLLKELLQRENTSLVLWQGDWIEDELPEGQVLFCLAWSEKEKEDLSLYYSLYTFLQKYGSSRLTLLTMNASPVSDGKILPTHTGLLGMAKSLQLEFSQLRVIDGDESLTAAQLLQELSQEDFCAAWRKNLRYVEKMLPYTLEAAQPELKNEGTYVITGGFGGMGSTFRDALHRQCANAHIVLLQRSATKEALPENVHAFCVDVADHKALEECFARIRAELPPLRGVIHTAGIAGGQFLATGSWDAFEAVLRPKILGAWNLARCTSEDILDFFVLCSSMSAVFGAMGQSEYTAANAFLDGFAHLLRQQGVPAVSVNWSGWSEIGMAASHGIDPEASPLAFLRPEEGFPCLLHAVSSQLPQLLIGAVKGALTGKTLDLSAYRTEEKQNAAQQKQITILGKGGAPLTPTEQKVAQAWAQTLGLEEVKLHEPFFDAGGSSLLISYLFKKLDEEFPGAIDITGLFVHETVAQIATYIDSRQAPQEEAPLERIGGDVESLVGQFVNGELSEAELEALLETLS